ncbi:MAG: ABC transporter permease [SAR324 cluster bacterium]|nr:peptide ABC transporter permease [Deltaproteobacteria bacterium]MEC7220221.1 ABC transporter permease [SAR324 cluster bacterium]MEC8255090.1 ABC transporter permease [SAR324 cluster bacterium]MEC8261063.1 ABC transporter permease [SAR324 cluster bacterium]MEC8358166.1 ABC transporter permease [SAR324 cluster bacterium]
MFIYFTRRLLYLIPMLLGISFLIYLGLELTPGDILSYLLPPEAIADMKPEELAAMREALGLNDPFIIRYIYWLGGILQGDFGYSLASGVPISQLVLERVPATLELSVAALLFSTFLGVILGSISALRRGSLLDNSLTIFGMIGVSIPEFIFGLSALVIFALQLEWLPVGKRLMPGYDSYWDHMPHLVMPAMVLGLIMTAGVMRYTRSSMLDSLNKEFIRTARSKGIPEWRINFIHGLRVALIPVVVLIGFRLPMLIGGTVIIEQVFQWPGIGNLFVNAVRGQNYPLVMMISFLSVTAVLFASFLIDLLTALLDPRIKLE